MDSPPSLKFWIVHTRPGTRDGVKNRQQLMDSANVVLDDNTITSHIKRIRRSSSLTDPAFAATRPPTASAIAGFRRMTRRQLLLVSLLLLSLPWPAASSCAKWKPPCATGAEQLSQATVCGGRRGAGRAG